MTAASLVLLRIFDENLGHIILYLTLDHERKFLSDSSKSNKV